MKNAIYIGSRRELLWDDYLVDTEESTTVFKLHEPIQRECAISFDLPHKSDCVYNCVMQDGDIYRMYTPQSTGTSRQCLYSESKDGIHWEQPHLDYLKVEGMEHNSFLPIEFLPGFTGGLQGFRVFKDEHPDCKPEERYKAVSAIHERIQVFVGPDGIHFKQIGDLPITGVNQGSPFDSVNTLFYDQNTSKYKAYVRDYVSSSNPEDVWVRSVSMTESAELFPKQHSEWPRPKLLRYDTPNAWQMYINSILPYYRAPHMYIGFPSRYVERKKWTDNYDELCGYEDRLKRAGKNKNDRHGLAISDTMFMCSRDGLNWTRYPDAFVRPGPEHPYAWIYGGCYFSNGIIETKSAHPGCDNEISFFCGENRFFDENTTSQLWRYSIRMDGFASQSSVYPEANLYTKPFIFEGKDLFINFSTSAYGYMRFTIKDEDGKSISSCQTFGDSTDRRVRFDGDLSAFAGKPVTMQVNMVDADFYSFIFR